GIVHLEPEAEAGQERMHRRVLAVHLRCRAAAQNPRLAEAAVLEMSDHEAGHVSKGADDRRGGRRLVDLIRNAHRRLTFQLIRRGEVIAERARYGDERSSHSEGLPDIAL